VKASDVTCSVLCVSAGADRNVTQWISELIAARYQAEQQIHPGTPHWIVAGSALHEVAPPVVVWLRKALGLAQHRSGLVAPAPVRRHCD
jgi:hypothetical protein